MNPDQQAYFDHHLALAREGAQRGDELGKSLLHPDTMTAAQASIDQDLAATRDYLVNTLGFDPSDSTSIRAALSVLFAMTEYVVNQMREVHEPPLSDPLRAAICIASGHSVLTKTLIGLLDAIESEQ